MSPITERIQTPSKEAKQKASKDTKDCPSPSPSVNLLFHESFNCRVAEGAVGDCIRASMI